MYWPFVVDRDGYSFTEIEKTRTVATQGGYPRERTDLLDGTTIVNCSFTFSSRKDYNLFQKFWLAYKARPQWFRIKLLTDIDTPAERLRLHSAQVVIATYRLQSFGGHRWRVSMQLEAYLDENIYAPA